MSTTFKQFLQESEKKPIAIVTHAISASGKSFWADAYVKDNANFKEINRDIIRNLIFKELNANEQFTWTDWDFKNEPEVTKRHREEILKASKSKTNVIISDTNLIPKFNKQLETYLEELGFEVKHKWFDTSLETCLERDAKRDNPVGEKVIRQQYGNYLKLKSTLK